MLGGKLAKSKVRQVQIQVMGTDGEWLTPRQVPAILAALRAMRADIAECPGSYSDGDLREFRTALRELDAQISERIGTS